ncbi:retrovirus-related pol polyprotein from transposon TNT 1-94 [Tanacetum coccineum]
MTKSSTKELIIPFENPKSAFRSKRRLYETPGLVESSSPELDLFSKIKDHSEEETIEIMTETMEQYMSKTRGNYGAASRWLRNEPSGSIANWETLKTKFLNKYCPPTRTAKKMEESNNFQQEPDESLFRAWERFKELLMKFPKHYLTDMQEFILFYNGLDVPTRQILDSKAKSTETSNGLAVIQAQLNNLGREIKKVNEKVYVAQYRAARPGFYQRNNRNSSYPNRRQTLEESLTKFITESAKRHEENSNIIKEIRASTDTAIRNQGASIKTLEIQIDQISRVLQERGIGGLPSSTEPNPRDHVKSISTTKADSFEIRHIGYSPYAISGSQHRSIFFEAVPFPRRLQNYCCDDWKEAQDVKILEAYDHTLPQKEKDLGSFTLPCFIHNVCFEKALGDLGASDLALWKINDMVYSEKDVC